MDCQLPFVFYRAQELELDLWSITQENLVVWICVAHIASSESWLDVNNHCSIREKNLKSARPPPTLTSSCERVVE